MPIANKSNFKIYDPRTQIGFREKIAEKIDLFNAAANGTIRLTSVSKPGELDLVAFFSRAADTVARRDPTSTAAVNSTAVAQTERARVKVNRRIGPYEATLDAFRKIGVNMADAAAAEDAISMAVGEAAAEYVLREKLTVALGCIAAGLRGVSSGALVNDISAGTGGAQYVTPAALNAANFKLGDQNDKVGAYIMHSAVAEKMFDAQIKSTVSGIGDVVSYGGSPASLGRPVLVTDNASLVIPAAGADPVKYITLGLSAGAIDLEDTEDEYIAFDTTLGRENITVIMQGEYAYNIGMDGFTWDVANGGVNPTNAALFTGTNWDLVLDKKNAGGVVLISQ